ncbi:MAG: PTS sugar transporter subunit IIA [Anaerolineales bacterium]|nr:MAG: PTS sugar transporter subunit IIA [Anaerolineales bacterium]
MVGIVIVSHGDMADGLLDAARMIVGEQDGLATVSLREMDAVEGLTERVAAAIEKVDGGDGVLVLVDLFGASPFNASARLAMQGDSNMEVISGVSLPMLVELMVQREGESLEKLVQVALEAGTSGVRTLSQTLNRTTS